MADWRQIAESADRERACGRIDQAILMFRSAVPEAEREGDPVALASLLHNFGLALDQAGEGLEARDVLQHACELFSSSPDGGQYLGETLRLLGMVEVELGDIEAGVSHVGHAISHFQARGETDGATRAQVDLGIALKDAGQLGEAEAHLATALTAARQVGLEKVMAHALTGLGLVAEKLERPDQARVNYLEALRLYRKLSDHDNEATTIYNIANLHNAAEEWGEAVRWLDEALALDVQSGNTRGAADCRASLASIEISQGNPARAETLHLEALAFYRSGGYRRRAIHSLVDLAAIARDGSRFAEAEVFLAEALQFAAELADPLEIHDVELHWGDLRFKSGDLPGARTHYAKAASAMRQARELLVREQDALSYFGEDRVECIDRLIVLAADDPRECVEWVERAKGQELVRRLAEVPLPPPRLAPPPLVLAQQQAAEQVRRLSAQLSSEAPATPDLLAAYKAAQDTLRSANATLGEFDPEWAMLLLGDAPSWADLQVLLSRLAADDPDRGVVIVHYYLRETTAAVIGLLPGRDPELVLVAMPLADLRSAAAVPGSRSWPRTEDLLSALVAPITAWADPGDRVVLCPHDILHSFPLHAISAGGKPLGERNVVTYTPSVAVLRYCIAKRRGQGDHDHALILADTDAARPLPFAHDQALALTGMLSDHGMSVVCHVRETATLVALADGLLTAGAAAFVHFAVHGSADPSGLDSGIQLADGRLTARQLLGLRLASRLVFLGACDTGKSERRAGDELLGLIRSAIYAGSPSVTASQWPVDQLSSTMLVLDFYHRLLAGSGKADALHASQLWLRQATAHDVLGYLSTAGARGTGDPRAEVAVGLARAQVHLFASDPPAALEVVEHILAQPDLTGTESQEATRVQEHARLVALVQPHPDYSRQPFSDPLHWAPFILVGDAT
jgi:CHAT domain-containing protein/tetratricopeptide (TPR) repeat protein